MNPRLLFLPQRSYCLIMKVKPLFSQLVLLCSCALLPFSATYAEDEIEPAPRPDVPDDLIDDPHVREQLGVNQFTAPSIKLIFDDLDKLTPLPADDIPHKISSRMPLNRTDLAVEMGFYIADGFMAVQAGQMNKIEDLAKNIASYGKSLGAGERVNRHAASLLESAGRNDVAALKKELTATQRDVETDLIHLRDVDLAHLISLGGWIRALEVGSHAVFKKYTPQRAAHLYRPDIADYYQKSIDSLDPRIASRTDIKAIQEQIQALREMMTIGEGIAPTEADVKAIAKAARKLSVLALERKK